MGANWMWTMQWGNFGGSLSHSWVTCHAHLTLHRFPIFYFAFVFQPEWKVADPICTFIFSVLVLFTTVNILRDTTNVLMEGNSTNMCVSFVVKTHQAHFWFPV